MQEFLESSHLTDVGASQDFKHILIQRDQKDTPQPPSRLCSCRQDLLIRFPSHFCIMLSAKLDLVNAFSLQHTNRHRNQKRPISLFIKIPSHFSLFVLQPWKLHLSSSQSERCLFFFFIEVLEKKMTLAFFLPHCSPHLFRHLFSPLTPLLLSSPLSALTSTCLFPVLPAPVREERQPEQLPAQCVQPSEHPHRLPQPPAVHHAQ